MRTGLTIIAPALFMAATVASQAHAQNRALQQQLQQATRIDCVFSSVAKGDWVDGSPAIGTESAEFEASFFDIDVEGGTAEAEGRFGASYIIVRFAEGYLHFMQTLNAGPIYLTTVLAEPAGDGRFKAVHTRHEYTAVSLPGFTSRPEMYVGDCSLEQAQN